MAYNNGFPVNYPYYQQPMMQPVQMMPQQQLQNMQQVQPQQYSIAQTGFVRVRDENEARMYPVAPGNSVTFVNENAPFCYTKTVNMGQLDRPIFERYRLVKEDDVSVHIDDQNKSAEHSPIDLSRFALASDFEAIRSEIEAIKSDLYGIAGKKKSTVKKEAAVDE